MSNQPPKPEHTVPVDPALIPGDLKEVAAWVCWRWTLKKTTSPGGVEKWKWTKPPLTVTGAPASVTDPATWSSFDRALAAYQTGIFDGIGRVLTVDEGLVGVDLDHCVDRESGIIVAWAWEQMLQLSSYTERSPSGTGLRVWCRGTLPPGGRRKGRVEVYDDVRYLTVTGARHPDTPPTIEARTAELAAFHKEIFGLKIPVSENITSANGNRPLDLDDAALLDRARAAKNGPKFNTLWTGDITGFPSQSEADLALTEMLCFWVGRDAARIDKLFRQSGLFREKWDERHFSSGETYGQRTIAEAISRCTEVYAPRTRSSGSARAGRQDDVEGENRRFRSPSHKNEAPGRSRIDDLDPTHIPVPGDRDHLADGDDREDLDPDTFTASGLDEDPDEAPGAARAEKPAPPWPTPEPMPSGLLPVPPFESARLLPPILADWVDDVADRAQCPPDFVAIGVLVAAASVVGRQLTIRPKLHDDWTVVPNVWGLAVGRPGLMKTAAMHEAQRGLRRLVADAREAYQRATQQHEFDVVAAKARRAAIERQIKAATDRGESTESLRETFEAAIIPEPPTERRYLVNDATVEKLGLLLNENPNGLLVFRDEVTGLLRTMDRQGHENDRSFFCEAWNGIGSYTYDRIGRGTLHIEAACLSLLGGIQPTPLASYLIDTFSHGQDDGLIQRFQLLVYPDIVADWINVDRWPDSEARQRLVACFQALNNLDLLALGAHVETGALPFLHFMPEAQAAFDVWRSDLEHRLRTTDEHPVLIAHLAKYRSLVPSLALLFHVIECVDRGQGGPISGAAVCRALDWVRYLEPHARRVYQPVTNIPEVTAAALGAKLRAGLLPSPFRARSVRLKGWSGLTTAEQVATAIAYLIDLGWVREVEVPTTVRGGRSTFEFLVNPALQPDDGAQP
jgi:uncharacterized protein DUF3987/primase/DNA polymerase family protein